MSTLDRAFLERLLVFDPASETIFGVVGRMNVLLEHLKRSPKHNSLVPFLETYVIVTGAVAQHALANPAYYADYPALERLDVYFAYLYFRPLYAYLSTGRAQTPWRAYFTYCKKKEGIPFLQMLLGINAHINSDLCVALVETGYGVRKDFLAINSILEETIPEIMRFLAFNEHDALGLGGLLFKQFFANEFKRIIVNWRQKTWQNAQKYSSSLTEKLNRQTELVGTRLIETFDDLYHLRNVVKTTQTLHSFSVRL